MNIFHCAELASAGVLRGKRVLIRADLNVPFTSEGRIAEETRILASLPCITIALEAGAAVMVASHLGRPEEGGFDAEFSLAPIAERLGQLLGKQVKLCQNWLEGVSVGVGEVVVLENCRFNVGEKKNDPVLAKKIASLCDVFVHDAFGTAHRKEASTYGVAEFAPIACAGPLLVSELEAIDKALTNPRRPLVAIVGGSKVSSKLTILQSLAQKVDYLVVGGGIANTFLLQAEYAVGSSLVEKNLVQEAETVLRIAKEKGCTVVIPSDVVVAKEFHKDADGVVRNVRDVKEDEMILDIGPQSSIYLADLIAKAKTIVWNGPVGVFEFISFAQGTQSMAMAIAQSEAFSLAGGGDTLAAIAQYDIEKHIDYVSTGGGAFLEVLEGKQLPAFEVLQKRFSKR